jgi:hypothetical protein
MKREDIIAAVRAAAINNKITCEKARGLSRKLGISLPAFGRICNELKIKISACQLGCF